TQPPEAPVLPPAPPRAPIAGASSWRGLCSGARLGEELGRPLLLGVALRRRLLAFRGIGVGLVVAAGPGGGSRSGRCLGARLVLRRSLAVGEFRQVAHVDAAAE